VWIVGVLALLLTLVVGYLMWRYRISPRGLVAWAVRRSTKPTSWGAAWLVVARLLRGTQVGENGEHPAVIAGVGADAELSEDRVDVLFDRAAGDDEPL
jgi:uncharacterized iron-regulated membrane protein